MPEIGDGEALVRTEWMSLDPTNRTWIDDTPTYLPPVAIGEVMRGLGLGRVVKSNHPATRRASSCRASSGWQEYVVASDAAPLLPTPDVDVSPSAVPRSARHDRAHGLGGHHPDRQPAARRDRGGVRGRGAVGSVAGQLAKAKGARVVGIAGGPDKTAMLTDELGFDAVVDYKADDWREQLVAATPDGIDVDFENVGGEIMDAIFARLNLRSRVALCGLISGYNDERAPAGPRAFSNLLIKRSTLQGFIVLDHFHQAPEAVAEISRLMADGRLKPLETVVEGFDQLPEAINMLFDGANVGKLVVRLNGD